MTPTAERLPNDYPILYADLPGPTRKRTHSPYRFRLTHRSAEPWAEGCVLLWAVDGGRMTYQIAVEREADGGLRWHCTCADAVYRGEDYPDYQCKHVRALRSRGRKVEACPSGNERDHSITAAPQRHSA